MKYQLERLAHSMDMEGVVWTWDKEKVLTWCRVAGKGGIEWSKGVRDAPHADCMVQHICL